MLIGMLPTVMHVKPKLALFTAAREWRWRPSAYVGEPKFIEPESFFGPRLMIRATVDWLCFALDLEADAEWTGAEP